MPGEVLNPTVSGRLRRCGSDGPALLFHRCFKGLAGRLPSAVHQRDMTAPLPFAGVHAGILAAAPLSLTLVLRRAGMVGHAGARSQACAGIVFASAQPLAGIESAARVRLVQNQRLRLPRKGPSLQTQRPELGRLAPQPMAAWSRCSRRLPTSVRRTPPESGGGSLCDPDRSGP